MNIRIDIGKKFSSNLTNRYGDYSGKEFRIKFIDEQISHRYDFWHNPQTVITLDFQNVDILHPSFANEAFAYYTKFATPDVIKRVIKFINITQVQMATINVELDEGYIDEQIDDLDQIVTLEKNSVIKEINNAGIYAFEDGNLVEVTKDLNDPDGMIYHITYMDTHLPLSNWFQKNRYDDIDKVLEALKRLKGFKFWNPIKDN